MDADRLNKLKLKVELATSLAEQIENLTKTQYEADSRNLDYVMRCEIYRLGREALLAKKEAELEELLGQSEQGPTPGLLPSQVPAGISEVGGNMESTVTPRGPEPFATIANNAASVPPN